ncbi:berberine bridge enzyme-like 4, partial [Carica papaya]|uniref:berberine bridge enzyme-like 4 n=1 Tax=Carica papaya TaxID=3649 RepID=UPI000B8D083F
MSLHKMKQNSIFPTVSILVFFLISISRSATSSPDSSFGSFLNCLLQSPSNQSVSKAIFTPSDPSFQSIYEAYANNLRFWTPETPKPLAIIAALEDAHVQATVICGKKNNIQIRIRSGGHDFEGLSYVSFVPFVILDMFNLRAIDVDIASETAWVQAGATTGELYYRIAEKSDFHAFPAGVCTTLGTGGHFSGGGYGTLIRKYGLSIDNIIDAQLVDANGRILDRKSMGEDLFWAIRGGGGASFGVILSWKIKLVRVPPKVTVFNVVRTLKQGATDIVYKWQQVSSKLDKDLFIRVMPQVVNGDNGQKTVNISFIGHFLGQTDRLLELLNRDFPELGLQRNDC